MTNSLPRLLIILGLVIIPFYEIFLHALPFVQSLAPDSRVTKELIALVFALAIGLLAVWQGTLKPFRNKYFLILPVYILLSLIMSPHLQLNINNNEVGDFYFWKPFAEVLCFVFMIFAVASYDGDVDGILRVMIICGVVMSGYVILQFLGFDQFWLAKGDTGGIHGNQFTAVPAHNIGGNLGQPTIVASWLVMMIPLAMYLKRWWMVIVMAISVFLCQSIMADGAIGLIWAISAVRYNRFLIIPIIFILLAGGLWAMTHKAYVMSRMDGRNEVWGEVLHDIKYGQILEGQKFSITGVGLGRFSFVFPDRHHSPFQQAHNDMLEFIYNCGLVGGFLLLAGLFLMVKGVSPSQQGFSILLSFIAVFFCSLGSFPFQLGAHQFYSAVLVGLLNNRRIS